MQLYFVVQHVSMKDARQANLKKEERKGSYFGNKSNFPTPQCHYIAPRYPSFFVVYFFVILHFSLILRVPYIGVPKNLALSFTAPHSDF